jgi:uncharacterized membrane protein
MFTDSAEVIQRVVWVIMFFLSIYAMRNWYKNRLPGAYHAWALGGIANLSLFGAVGVLVIDNAVSVIMTVILILSLWFMAIPEAKKTNEHTDKNAA